MLSFNKKNKKENTQVNVSEKRNSVIAGILLLILGLFVIFASIPWESLISKFTAFSKFNSWLSGLKIGDYAIFNNVIGSPVVTNATTGSTGVIAALGSWVTIDVAIMLVLVSAVIVLFNRKEVKLDDYIAAITAGIKKALPVAITTVLVSLVSIAFITSGVNVTITNAITSITKGFNIATTTFASMIGSITTSDNYYFLSTLYAVFQKAAGGTDLYGVVAFIIQSIYYLMMIIAPTSIALIVGLYSMNISYCKWLKYIWKAFLAIFVVIIIAAIVVYIVL